MKKVLAPKETGGNVPIKAWTPSYEESAMQQAINAAKLPFVYKHVALMPDFHVGYGAAIGSVIATRGVVIVNCVGVDIGCGMCAVETTIPATEVDLKAIMKIVRRTIPVGFKHHAKPQREMWMPALPTSVIHAVPVVKNEYDSARKQVGTLGGGNHFIELQKDEQGFLWIMIHSGSRNLGYKVAKYYNDEAKRLNAKWFSHVDPKWDLAFLPLDDDYGRCYMAEMNYCTKFAFNNRDLMMERVKEAIEQSVPGRVDFKPMINIAHNYAAMENHFGKNVVVHRKGATRARKDEIGIIPGSQGTASYIVRGLGNPESFQSCSHGAGRVMGRKEAKRTLDLEVEKKRLDDQGIIHSIRSRDDLDEATSCYKNIDTVMNNQSDLVEVVTKLTPLAVIKG